MRYKRDDVHFSVTLERYASHHQNGNLSTHLFIHQESAEAFANTQMSTGAFIRARLERVECVTAFTWHEWAERYGKHD